MKLYYRNKTRDWFLVCYPNFWVLNNDNLFETLPQTLPQCIEQVISGEWIDYSYVFSKD